MSEEDTLLAAIHAHPDDDTLRLAYADWLDENGQPARAEFVRLQIAAEPPESAEERRRRSAREWELLAAHRDRWTADLGPFDRARCRVDFRRGFADGLRLEGAGPADLAVAARMPLLRRLELSGCTLDPAAVRRIAALPHLDSLDIRRTPFRREWLRLLDPLPCGTSVRIHLANDATFGRRVWDAFHERRLARLADLTPDQRRAEALRYVRTLDRSGRWSRGQVARRVDLSQQPISDPELRLLAELPEVEEFYNSDGNFTAAGLGHLAALPNLRSLELFGVRVESVAPLSRYPRLERLQLFPRYETVVGDAGTAGLERLAGLRELRLCDGPRGGYGDRTLARLGALRGLRVLDVELRRVRHAGSYAALARLTALEDLRVGSDMPAGALRFLAPLRRLRRLQVRVPAGSGDDIRHLAGLRDLSALHLSGDGVTDAAARHLAPLAGLRALMAQGSAITPAGARWLADRLPGVTIILDRHVAKSPRASTTFRRRAAGGFASVLLPTHWPAAGRDDGGLSVEVREDGWEDVGGWPGGSVWPGTIRLSLSDEGATAALHGTVRNNSHLRPRVLERGVVGLPGRDTASCVFQQSGSKHLVAAAAAGGRCATLECSAPPARFAELRPLFEFVTRSLRVGVAAVRAAGEEQTVGGDDALDAPVA